MATIIDLMILAYFEYEINKNDLKLINIFNLTIKFKINQKFGEIKLPQNLDFLLNILSQEEFMVLQLYNNLMEKLAKDNNVGSSDLEYALYQKLQYLKVFNQLEIDDVPEETIEEILSIIFTILEQHENYR